MQVISDPDAMRSQVRQWHAEGHTVGLVPTMGALHEGHSALIRHARQNGDRIVVSVFVNPDQFGPQEDFSEYPRPFEADRALCESLDVDAIFHPAAEDIAPPGRSVSVVELDLSAPLCGQFRPGHFTGVLSIVAKLFNISEVDFAVFGQKDAQQARLIEALVKDLSYGIEIQIVPTIREKDGLALSSRNRYLSASEREQARVISRALFRVKALHEGGECDVGVLSTALNETLAEEPGLRVQYAEILTYDRLAPATRISEPTLVALAGHVGSTRLIDNVILLPVSR